MTNEEAIEMLTRAESNLRVWGDDLKTAKKMACKALEKQIPKKPKITLRGTTGWNTVCHCPSCCGFLVGTDKFCHKCGQALDWGTR